MLIVSFILFILLVIPFSYLIYKFFKTFYSRGLLINTYAEFIPSLQIENDYMILNKDSSYSAVLLLKGFSYSKEENPEETKEKNLKLRERALNFIHLDEGIQIKFLFKKYKEGNYYQNGYFIEITTENKDILSDSVGKLQSSLSIYSPIILNNKDLIKFLFYNSNLVSRNVNNNTNINDLCSYSRVDFVEDNQGIYGIINNSDIKKYFKCYSFNFGSEIDDKYFHNIMTSNMEFDFIINTKFFNKMSSNEVINTDKKNIQSSNDETKKGGVLGNIFNSSNKKISEIGEAQELVDNEEATLAVFDCFVILFADNLQDLKIQEDVLKQCTNNYDIYLIEEKYLLNFFFFQRLIGFRYHNNFKFFTPYGDILLYAKKVLSCTLAGMLDYIETPKGLNKCDWGDKPIAKINTHYNNSYNFYFHVSENKGEVGHGVVIAPTGSGKTTFISYLIKGIKDNYKDEIDIYSFDRFSGMSVFTNWVKGTDVDFSSLNINPLQINLDIEDNIDFLNNFLEMLCKPQTIEDKETLNNFIDVIKRTPVKDRILSNLVNFLIPGDIKDNLQIWVEGKYAKYINAPSDELTLDSSHFNFQMDKILDDEELCSPILYYIMFKIRSKARSTGRGHFVFIDESAKMVGNKYFRKQIDVLLTEHRKLRGCVWLAFQNPSMFLDPILVGKDDKGKDIYESIKELVLNQCKNQVLFTSTAIKEDTLGTLNIHQAIYDEVLEVQKYYKNDYFILLKNPKENVILDINLKDILKDDLKFLSSSSEDVSKMRDLQEKYGEDWIKFF